jgi:hypothetical protein
VGKVFDGIDGALARWIDRQPLFFVATAPLAPDGHVNVSPKGPIGTLRVLDPHTVAYLDLLGSGAETVAHVRENGRIVVMLCAFAGPPRIVRLHGTAEVLDSEHPRFEPMLERCAFAEPEVAETRRAVVVVDVSRVADSCGYGVPLMDVRGQRPHAAAWAAKKVRTGGVAALAAYRVEKNSRSIDGLPAFERET